VKRFDGWEPLEESIPEYDGDQLVRTVTRREPEWDEEERAWILALLTYRSQIHEACGHYLPDSAAPEAEGEYVAQLPIRCHACTARAQMYSRVEAAGNQHITALLFPVKRKDW
jgi:hypothetical protein